MKALLHIAGLAFFLMIFGCNSEDEEIIVLDVNVQNISGTWKLTETYLSPGGETEWQAATGDHMLTFSEDGTFNASGLQNCGEGEYSFDDTFLILDCGDQQLRWRINTLASNTMILGGVGCTEACLYKYKRID
ncbi:lipocalin family protein [Zunongwangia sp. H14]|uniref:lipocalin family protein n=1 Tax=Zunongwangia sp. H14 TaxID=3240792 RepID=UPI003564B1B2